MFDPRHQLPPSFAKRDPHGWLVASVSAGLVTGGLALWALWRPLPFLPAPDGALADHAAYWAKLVAHALAPSLFNDSVAFYRGFWRDLRPEGRALIELRVSLAAIAAAAPFPLFAKSYLRSSDQLLHVRGGRRHEGKEAAKALKAKFRRFAARQPDHDLAPNLPWPSSMWTRHVLLAGGVGSGKSTVLRPLLSKIVEADEQLFLFDPKGEFTEAFDRPAIVAPWDSRSHAWDVAKDLRNIQDMRRFARAMIEDSHDPMWANAARQLLVGLLIHLRQAHGGGWSWRDLARLVSLPQPALLAIMSTCHPEAVRAVERASVTTTGVLINLAAFCSPINDLAEAWGDMPPERRVSVQAWIRGASTHRQLILQGHAGYAELTKCYVERMAGVFSSLINSVEFDDDPSRKLWFVADEFAQAGELPVRSLFEIGRSRGVRCVVACQDFTQLQEVYGDKFAQALLSMCGTLVVGQMMPGDTAESLCKVFGTREVERPNAQTGNVSGGGAPPVSFSREDLALYKPSELASRLGVVENGDKVRLIVFVGGETHEIEWPIRPLAAKRPRHEPAAWTLGVARTGKLKSIDGASGADGLGEAGQMDDAKGSGAADAAIDADPIAPPSLAEVAGNRHEEEWQQSVLREASGLDDPNVSIQLAKWREAYLRDRFAALPQWLVEVLLLARRTALRALARAAACWAECLNHLTLRANAMFLAVEVAVEIARLSLLRKIRRLRRDRRGEAGAGTGLGPSADGRLAPRRVEGAKKVEQIRTGKEARREERQDNS